MYSVYLDEFGHDGPFISRDHHKHKTHPAFGLGGFAIPTKKVREISTYFYKEKCRLLDFEIKRSKKPAYQWEKKGSQLYTARNVETYKELRQTTFKLINKIKNLDGFVIYCGVIKRKGTDNHKPKNLHFSIFNDLLKRLDSEFRSRESHFCVTVDQKSNSDFRDEIIATAGSAMFRTRNPVRNLIEPPKEVDSHLYQTLQLADWLCGIIGKISAFEHSQEWGDYRPIEKYFGSRIREASAVCRVGGGFAPAQQDSLERLSAKFAKSH